MAERDTAQGMDGDNETRVTFTGESAILMVAAIDFGTTYSGYAFSTTADYKKDKLKIHTNTEWSAGGRALISLKTPTCVLIDKTNPLLNQIDSFGFEAENNYADAVIDEQTDNYYFFNRFKMMLYTRKDISIDMTLEDVRGNSMPAIDVFAAGITALKQHMMGHIKKKEVKILKEDNIKWVLTVPAMWTVQAKEFMKESAKKINSAGIREDRLLIALEPEAASIFCQYLPPDQILGASDGFSVGDEDTKYLVVDIAGGTVDITAHHKVNKDELRELCSASGGACGGTAVDREFLNLLENIVGGDIMEQLKNDRTISYLDLLREFEMVKRTTHSRSRQYVNMTIPFTDLTELCTSYLRKDFKTAVSESDYKDNILLVRDKMRIDRLLLSSLYGNVCNKIVQEIRKVLKKKHLRQI